VCIESLSGANAQHRRDSVARASTATAAALTASVFLLIAGPARSRNVAARARMQGNVNKVVLAYSGGLDTSVILKWLKEEYDCQVITFTADLGQARHACLSLNTHYAGKLQLCQTAQSPTACIAAPHCASAKDVLHLRRPEQPLVPPNSTITIRGKYRLARVLY
jgi:Arginosuccinate synthase